MSLEDIGSYIRSAGVTRVILSSDFGQVANGNHVVTYGKYTEKIEEIGFSPEKIRQMTSENPRELFFGRFGRPETASTHAIK